MSREHADLWARALKALQVAGATLSMSPDAAASRAYYAAFYAVSALFASKGKTFAKHSGVRSAVHRALVRTGRWAAGLGETYDELMALRETGDYGAAQHVPEDEAEEAVRMAQAVLRAVSAERPDEFPMEDGL